MKVAILGTGRMGGAMAGTLARAGFDLTLWNRTPSKPSRVAADTGASVADTPADAVASADVVLSVLADREAVRAVFLGDDGAVARLRSGAVVCEMSTVEPEVSRELLASVRDTGADLLDCPVSGSVPAVESASLTIMVGGAADCLEVARPVLEALSARIIAMGDLGTGAAMKLAVNGVVHALNQALCEALVVAESAGIERSRAYEVFASSAVAAPFVAYKREAFEDPEGTPVAFTVDLVVKDLQLLRDLADRLAVPVEQVAANLRAATAAGERYGARDMAAIAGWLRERRGAAG